jgi:hypothetical protein
VPFPSGLAGDVAEQWPPKHPEGDAAVRLRRCAGSRTRTECADRSYRSDRVSKRLCPGRAGC